MSWLGEKFKSQGKCNDNVKQEPMRDSISMLSKDSFRRGSLWVCLIVGILLYAVYFTIKGILPELEDSSFLCSHEHAVTLILEGIIRIADFLLIGVVLGFVSNVAQFLRIFKKDLEEIVVDYSFLEKRADVADVWEKITKVLFKSRFKKISGDLLTMINENYFPKNKSVYYDNYTSNVMLEWDGNPSDEVLKVSMVNKYMIVSENKERISIPWRNWTIKSDEYEVLESHVFIDGKEQKYENLPIKDEDNEKVLELMIPIEGSEKYSVEIKLVKRYSFAKDFFRAYCSSYIMNGMVVSISHPDDLELLFIERGTCKKFDIISQTSTSLVARYSGLILPSQGYVVAMKHNLKS